jgi:predicted RNA-binding protein with PUA-like domain
METLGTGAEVGPTAVAAPLAVVVVNNEIRIGGPTGIPPSPPPPVPTVAKSPHKENPPQPPFSALDFRPMRYWLMKSEPDVYSIEDLQRDGTTCWNSVRNYQARNFMRDDMKAGDRVLFYHSNAKPPGVAGIAEVARQAYPDHTALDPEDDYFDPGATQDEPRWYMVDVRFVEKFNVVLPLDELKSRRSFDDMLVTGKSRLSVQPVAKKHYDAVVKLARRYAEQNGG